MVYHDTDMFFPFEVISDEDPKISQGGDGHDIVLGVGVHVLGSPDLASCEIWLVWACEDHEFGLCQVG